MLEFTFLFTVNLFLRYRIRAYAHFKFIKLLFYIGVILHESAHYVAAKLTFRKVTGARFIPNFNESPAAFVRYENTQSLIGKLIDCFIGLAPLILGLVLLFCINYLSPFDESSYYNINFISNYFPEAMLQTILILIISQCMLPSLQDIKNSLFGLGVLGVLISLNRSTVWDFIEAHIDVLNDNLILLLYYQCTALAIFLLAKFKFRR